jgi:hypothetical protein
VGSSEKRARPALRGLGTALGTLFVAAALAGPMLLAPASGRPIGPWLPVSRILQRQAHEPRHHRHHETAVAGNSAAPVSEQPTSVRVYPAARAVRPHLVLPRLRHGAYGQVRPTRQPGRQPVPHPRHHRGQLSPWHHWRCHLLLHHPC